jgi:t-SNARE complex subunit (syntaxin)
MYTLQINAKNKVITTRIVIIIIIIVVVVVKRIKSMTIHDQ